MALSVNLRDERTLKKNHINEQEALLVVNQGIAPYGLPSVQTIFRDYFRDSTNSFAMNINPPAGGTEFKISAPADQNTERFIFTLSFLISGVSAKPSQFGSISALTNGCNLEYSSTAAPNGVVSIGISGLKTNFDFVRLCGGQPAFGDATTAFLGANVVGNVDAYFPILNIKQVFGTENGIRLRGSSSDKIVIRINDNISTVTAFTCIASGYDRRKE
jgi:hypothetical protein